MCPPERRKQNRERIAKLFVFRLHFPADKLWNMYSNNWLFGGIFLIRKWKISLTGFRIQLGRSLCIKAFAKLQLLRWRKCLYIQTCMYKGGGVTMWTFVKCHTAFQSSILNPNPGIWPYLESTSPLVFTYWKCQSLNPSELQNGHIS